MGLAQGRWPLGFLEAAAEEAAARGAGQAAAALGTGVPGVLPGQGLRELSQVSHDGAAQALARAAPLLGQVGVVSSHFLGLVDLELGVELLQFVLGGGKGRESEADIEKDGLSISIPWLHCSPLQPLWRPFSLGDLFPTKLCLFPAFKPLRIHLSTPPRPAPTWLPVGPMQPCGGSVQSPLWGSVVWWEITSLADKKWVQGC